MKVYTTNNSVEEIVNNKIAALMANDVSQIYILNQIEFIIWNTFKSKTTIDDSYDAFSKNSPDIIIEKTDYKSFVDQLILNHLLVEV